MKTTLMVCSGDPEVIWNAFRMGNLMLEQMDDVTMFLNGPAVEYAALASERFPLAELAKVFTLSEGVLLA
ncbi:sulfur reduction protein DsrE [Desulfobulbus sp.]|uniref:sulfur reduction protein DsrE n=1 Tax=Desulfobulbus sp. TaxID=895 RepID=UPI00286F6809|nr:sulfur reduction protein DsrE [Desulfobulbus sp.]